MKVVPIDSTSLSVGGRRLNARQVDQLIHDLALARERIAPPIAGDIRKLAGNVVVHHEPAFQVSTDKLGQVTLCFRHAGLGWFVFSLGLAHAAGLRDFLAQRTKGVAGVGDIANQPAGPHGAH
jgi:hypothetical protein